MQEKLITLVRLLLKNNSHITGKQIASQLGISSRTVINYINSINAIYPEPIILSDHDGYIVDRERAHKLLETANAIPDGYKERAFFICKRLLLEQDKSSDAFDLSDEMYISYSLLKNDLNKMNLSFAHLNVKFVTKNNIVQITGTEKNKRKLMNHMLHEIQEPNFFDISNLKRYFPENIVNTSLEILENAHKEHGYYLNDFARLNILLHILTMVQRISSGNIIQQDIVKENDLEIEQGGDYTLAKTIEKNIEKKFNIKLTSEDALQLYLMISSCSILVDANNKNTILNYVGEKYLALLKEIILKTEEAYYIRLYTDEFFMRFALHINNLVVRTETEVKLVNPMKDTLRTSIPFLYDVAISIANQLHKANLLQTELSEDEISFIVLHIGAEIERQTEAERAIKCTLLVPNYLDVSQTMAQKLICRFGDRMIISQIVSSKECIKYCDLVITTLDKNIGVKSECVYVSPFLSTIDYIAIDNAINHVQLEKSQEYLETNFDYFFSKENFILMTTSTKNEAINSLCDLLEKNEYVGNEFKANVFKREEAISTAYTDFAIPHSVCNEATSNGIGVLVAEGGVVWDDTTVYVVFLMAISPDSLNDFQALYDILARILMDTSVIKSMRNCKSFEEFKKLLLNSRWY